jgi:hypothetical protein
MHPIVDLNSMELLEIDDVETPVEPADVHGGVPAGAHRHRAA